MSLKSVNWFYKTLLEEDEEGKSGISKIVDKRRAILKIFAVAWGCVLIMAFTLPLVVRIAMAIPIF